MRAKQVLNLDDLGRKPIAKADKPKVGKALSEILTLVRTPVVEASKLENKTASPAKNNKDKQAKPKMHHSVAQSIARNVMFHFRMRHADLAGAINIASKADHHSLAKKLAACPADDLSILKLLAAEGGVKDVPAMKEKPAPVLTDEQQRLLRVEHNIEWELQNPDCTYDQAIECAVKAGHPVFADALRTKRDTVVTEEMLLAALNTPTPVVHPCADLETRLAG